MKKTSITAALLMLLCASTSYAGVSVDESQVLDRWKFRIGGFLTGLDTKIRLDSPSGLFEGTTVSLEDDLGFDSSASVPRLNLAFIIGKRHQISAGYFETDRDSSTTLQREIEWGDEVFPINLSVGATYTTTFANIAYTYYFYTSETTALGVTGGLVWTQLSAGLGFAVEGIGGAVEDDISTDVPVPQLGFSVNHYLGKRFVLNGALGYIGFSLDDWDGSVATAFLGVEHRTWKNFGFGLGYGYTSFDVDAKSRDFLGNWEYTIDGFEIYVRAAW